MIAGRALRPVRASYCKIEHHDTQDGENAAIGAGPAGRRIVDWLRQPKLAVPVGKLPAPGVPALQGRGGGRASDRAGRDLQKIRSSGKTPPPGYHAHLGMLYASLGKDDQMVQQFQTEKQLFPESAAYMDFLLKKAKK